MSKYFERQLEELHVQLITLGSYCEKAISFSAKAIQKVQNEEIARRVFETDRDIDAKEREIENLCLSLLLHQHPVARDLREISAALKIVSDMERIGDQAADIADLSLYIAKNTSAIPDTITKMAEDTVSMVTESVDAFVKSDLELCRNVIDRDDVVDDAFNEIKEKLADMIYSTSVTIVIISPHMKESNWIDWEIEYSLTQTTRNDRTSRINGVVGVVMKVNGGYDWFIHPRINCHGTQVVTYDNSLLYPIVSNNHFNSEPEQWHCSQCKTFDWLNGSYIEYVKEEDFLLNPSMYVENAYTKSQNGGAGYRLQRTRKN